jgi:polar amino acid transport system substrate-binding protein
MHPQKTVRILDLDESEPNLSWNVAIGMVRPDEKLREAIDAALARLRADGTIDRIYRRYGVALRCRGSCAPMGSVCPLLRALKK